jgi:putative oxidoreductase
MRPIRTAGRGLLSAIFIVSGLRALADPEKLAAPAKRFTDQLGPLLEKTELRVPTDPVTLVRINATTHVVGGLLLATGHCTRLAATALAGSLIPTSLSGHPFWTLDDPEERLVHQVHFLKNLGLFGGLLLAAADNGGRPSLRWRTARLVRDTRRSMRRGIRTTRREAWIAAAAARVGRRLPS